MHVSRSQGIEYTCAQHPLCIERKRGGAKDAHQSTYLPSPGLTHLKPPKILKKEEKEEEEEWEKKEKRGKKKKNPTSCIPTYEVWLVRPIASHNFNNINNNNEKREEAAMGLLVYWFYSLCSRYGFLPSLGSSMLALYTSLFFFLSFFSFSFPLSLLYIQGNRS